MAEAPKSAAANCPAHQSLGIESTTPRVMERSQEYTEKNPRGPLPCPDPRFACAPARSPATTEREKVPLRHAEDAPQQNLAHHGEDLSPYSCCGLTSSRVSVRRF